MIRTVLTRLFRSDPSRHQRRKEASRSGVRLAVNQLEDRTTPAPLAPPKWNTDARLRGAMISPDALLAHYAPNAPNTLTDWKVNALRVELVIDPVGEVDPNNPELFQAQKTQYQQWLDGEVAKVKSVLPQLRRDGIGVILDMHDPFGGPRWGDFAVDSKGDKVAKPHQVFNDAQVAAVFREVWQSLAREFSFSPEIIGFDLLNEPLPVFGNVAPTRADTDKINTLLRDTVGIIRAEGGLNVNRLIVVEPMGGNLNLLERLRPNDFRGQNVVVSFHYYGPAGFANYSNDLADGNPVQATNEKFTNAMRTKVDADLARVARWQAANGGVRVYVGEFNASLRPDSTTARKRAVADFLKFVTDAYERNRWDWSIHAFREFIGWDLEKNFVKKNPVTNTFDTDTSLWSRSGLKVRWASNARIVMRPAFGLQIAASNKVLDADSNFLGNGGRVQLWGKNGGSNQQWRIENFGDGTFVVWNVAAGRVLDAHAPDVGVNGCRVQLWDFNGQLQQRWRIEQTTAGNFRLVNAASGKVLDAHAPDAGNNGGRLQLWDDLGGANQRFKLSLIV